MTWMRYGALLALAAGTLAGCGPEQDLNAANRPAGPHVGAPGGGPAAGDAPAGPAASGHSEGMGVGMDMEHMSSMEPLRRLNGPAFELAFLSEMVEHHAGAVLMAEGVLRHGRRPEVQAAARKIIADQRAEMAEMTRLHRQLSGQAPSADLRRLMKNDMQPMMDAFSRDCATDCDRAFLTHMIPHHQMALHMAQMALDKSDRPELKRMAETMIREQSKEISQFQAWLAAE